MLPTEIRLGLTFDDVLLLPAASSVLPNEVQLGTRLTRNLLLPIPLLSSAMDTVTGARMAIAMAQEGGLGIIHKNMSPAEQAAEVARVKKHESGMVVDPVTIEPGAPLSRAIALMQEHGLKEDLASMEEDLELVQDDAGFKRWLKSQKQLRDEPDFF